MEQTVSWIIPRHPRPDYPLFVFLPGMDGTRPTIPSSD
jgi:hypothetical protein